MEFRRPGNRGTFGIDAVIKAYRNEVKIHGQSNVKIMIGTDSQRFSENFHFVTAFTIYRVGKGGMIFYRKVIRPASEFPTIQLRMLKEAEFSINTVTEFTNQLQDFVDINIFGVKVEIHLDVNQSKDHASNDVLKAVTGWVTGMGYDAVVKPDAVGASTVADKFAISGKTT